MPLGPDPATTPWVPVWDTKQGVPGGSGLHAPSHGVAGVDPVALDATQIVSGVLVPARLPATVAYVNASQNFTGTNVFAGFVRFDGIGTASPMVFNGQPGLNLYDTSQAADQHIIRIVNASRTFYVQDLNDAQSTGTVYMSITRFGLVVGDGTNPIYANGSPLTNLNASALTTGIAAPARLGSGAASTSTFLRGDGVWAVPPTGSGVPSGLIGIFSTPCPAGWTRVAALDNRFPLGWTTYGDVGGDSRHSHGVSGTVAPGGNHDHGFAADTSSVGDHTHHYSGQTGNGLNATMNAGNGITQVSTGGHSHSYDGDTSGAGGHNHSVSGRTDAPGNHAHGFSGATDTADQYPPYMTVFFCRKD